MLRLSRFSQIIFRMGVSALPQWLVVLRTAVVAFLVVCVAATVHGDDAKASSMHVVIDATDLPRKLLQAKLTIPIDSAQQGEAISLWYPKWVPGAHAPGGPIANVAGLIVEDSQGNVLSWRRAGGEVFRIEVDVPAGASCLVVKVRYIANQPTENSFGTDVFGASKVGLISPGCVLFYVDGMDIDEDMIACQVQLPSGWQASSALIAKPDAATLISYEPATLRTFVDSPIMCGRYRKTYTLSNPDSDLQAAHELHVFSEDEASTNINEDILEKLRSMVAQTAELTRSQPFDRFTVLLAATDQLPANGLEHARSTMNVLPRRSLASASSLKGWNRLLIPHEYLHTWCGKYRRPDGMVTSDFHTPKSTELLWVYEGLTQYLGELIEARCGLMTKDEFRHRLAVELRNATHQQNRMWRSLADTGAASHLLRKGSSSWPKLRGGQDYYMEGMLLWLEIDALLRTNSENTITIEDFCRQFFALDGPPGTAERSPPKAFDRDEIVRILNELAEYDWDGLIRRRVESPMQSFDTSVASLLGYQFAAESSRPSIPSSTFRHPSGIDEYDTLGAIFSSDGTVTDVLLGSPVDAAKLGPGTKILGVNGKTWSAAAIASAVQESSNSSPVELLIREDDTLRTVQVHYYGGASYLTLKRDEGKTDLLDAILEPIE